ncbi:MAG: NHL repeat-containing protein [Spirochaetes bacterium]|nr:NHL repeat-containing protein [Spirochaetota bacterium]
MSVLFVIMGSVLCGCAGTDGGNEGLAFLALFGRGYNATAVGVYGQLGAFDTGDANKGGISADSMDRPNGIAVDAGGVYISEYGNNRVLYYSLAEPFDTTADRVYGQAGAFNTGTADKGGTSADSLQAPVGVAVADDGVYIADHENYRVLYYPGTSTTATRVYGQGDSFTTSIVNNGGISADGLNLPTGVAVDAGGVYIVDCANSRVLYYSLAEPIDTTADRVYGQGGAFDTGDANKGGSISADSLSSPYRMAVGDDGIYIADYANNRVLYYPGTSTTATRVYGQGGAFDTNTANKGGVSARSLDHPQDIAFDAGGVYISDYGNNRVLYYPGTSTTATRVYGQGKVFDTDDENKGGSVSADSLSSPKGIAPGPGGQLYIVDADNNRALWY